MITSAQSKNSGIALEASLHPDVPLADDIVAGHSSAPAKGKETGGTSKVEKPPPSVPDFTNITPDALMSYCESRLNSLDTQMTDIFNAQQKNATSTEALNNVAGALNDLPVNSTSGSSSTTSKVDATDRQAVLDQYQTAIDDAGPGTSLAASLTKDRNTFENAVPPGGGNISSDQLSGLSQNLKDDTSNLNSDSEMTMINLQSLMTQRQTAVQLTTNLMQSLGDQAGDIAKNVGQ